MPLTDDEEEKLRFMISTLEDERKNLSTWERGFLDDQIKRYDEFGSKMSLSPKQWAVINNMYEKVT